MSKVLLIVLDGWGIGEKTNTNAIFCAKKPFYDQLIANHPNISLRTDGSFVGLPEGQMGNSEVGHLTLGAGQKIEQELTKISKQLTKNFLDSFEKLKTAIEQAKKNNKNIHLIGLMSRAGVHSHTDHLLVLLNWLQNFNLNSIFLHAITDGRDGDVKSAEKELNYVKKNTKDNVFFASMIGRYYAMDRDFRWDRIAKAYQLWVEEKGEQFADFNHAIASEYQKNRTDEFFYPCKFKHYQKITSEDVVICFNFRTDRCRELVQVLTQKKIENPLMNPLNLHFFTLTEYDSNFKNISVIFEKEQIKNTLAEKLAKAKKTQLRAAETEKYPHVTYFFSGGREEKFPLEERILVPSPKISTYDLMPEMSAYTLTEQVLDFLTKKQPDFALINFANADMVGHTGVFSAIVKAIETVDLCLENLVPVAEKNGYDIIILSDHGNAELTKNAQGEPHTAHTLNPVPCIFISYKNDVEKGEKLQNLKGLADLNAFISELMVLD